jgi:hypothetical protein
MAVLASSRAGNLVRSLLVIAVMALALREIYLLWFFHTAAWTSRPAEIKYCGHWYERQDSAADTGLDQAETTTGGPLRRVTRSPVLRPVLAYKPDSSCPHWLFAKVGSDRYVTYIKGG